MDTEIYVRKESVNDRYLVEYIDDHKVVRKHFSTLGEVVRLVYFLLLVGHTIDPTNLKQLEDQYFKTETA